MTSNFPSLEEDIFLRHPAAIYRSPSQTCGQTWLEFHNDSDCSDRAMPAQRFETICSSGGRHANRNTTIASRLGMLTSTASVKLKRLDPVKMAYLRTSFIFGFSVLITWIPSSINRLYSLANNGHVSYQLSIASGCVLPLQGVWNAIIFFTTSWKAVRGEARALKARFGYGVGECPRLVRLESRLGISSTEDCVATDSRCQGTKWCRCGKHESGHIQLEEQNAPSKEPHAALQDSERSP